MNQQIIELQGSIEQESKRPLMCGSTHVGGNKERHMIRSRNKKLADLSQNANVITITRLAASSAKPKMQKRHQYLKLGGMTLR